MEIIIFTGITTILAITVGICYAKVSSAKKREEEISKQLLVARGQIEEFQRMLDESREQKTIAETKLANQIEHIEKLESERLSLTNARDQANNLRNEAEKREQLMAQQLETNKKQMADWEQTKQQHLEASKASIAEVGSKLSSKLLDDHKREAEVAKKESEKIFKENSEKINQHFETVVKSLHTFDNRINKAEEASSLIERSLLSPSGAGALAETTLANIFKNSSLREGQDYVMQYSIQGQGLRPDAVVFLPDGVMVIDSKASKFFVDIENTKNEEEKKELQAKLKTTMANHLKSLVSKDYMSSIREQLKKSGRVNESEKITMCMFLPTEAAVGKLREIDPKFEERAWKERILPIGPTGLVNSLLQAELYIFTAMQKQNEKVIIDEVKGLLGSVAKIQELSQGVGKGIESAFKRYDKFAASFNRTFLSKVKKLDKLGASSGKEIKQLERYQIISNDSMIEGIATEEEEQEILRLEEKVG